MDNPTMPLASILDNIADVYRKYLVLPNEHCAPTLALWVAHTWISTSFYTTPRLIFCSPVPGSGKTRGLEITNLFAFNARMTISSSSPALFRRIGAAHQQKQIPPTILFDEIDAIFGTTRPSEQTEQLRGLMNSGYKRGATVDRCEGDASQMKVVEWPVFAPLALAGISGHLPDTITSRAIMIEMKKRTASEKVAPYRERDVEQEVAPIVKALQAWANDQDETAIGQLPTMPSGVEDRAAEVWEPLLAIADKAGEHWPEAARAACVAFVFKPSNTRPPIAVELLEDIRTVMGWGADTSYEEVNEIPTMALIGKLKNLEESPWSILDGGGGITPRRLSGFLSNYEVRPITLRTAAGQVSKGYSVSGNSKQVGLADAWARYLKPINPAEGTALPAESVTTVTTVTPQVDAGKNVTEPKPQSVTETEPVTNGNAVTSTVTDVTNVTDIPRRAEGTDVNHAILNALSTTEPMNLGALMRLVQESTGVGAAMLDELDQMQKAGIITKTDNGRYLKPKDAA